MGGGGGGNLFSFWIKFLYTTGKKMFYVNLIKNIKI